MKRMGKVGAVIIAFILVFLVGNVKAKENEVYLSDIDYLSESRAGWGTIVKDAAGNGNKISVKVEGAYYTFEKGMWAHATSTLVYDIREYDYKYFTAYLGLNNTAASSSNGVIYKIYTSSDKNNWNLVKETPVIKAGTNSEFVKIDIEDVNYLKLVADSNGPNGNDHSVYADAKLTDEDESLISSVKSVAWYDNEIKEKYEECALGTGTCTDEKRKEYELVLYQRELVKRAGPYALRRFTEESEDNLSAFNWLFNNLEILELYILGGAPEGGSYYNSLTVLSKLYSEYKEDFINEDLLNNKWDNTLTYGDLYKKMAVSIALTHSRTVGLWMNSGIKENQSDPCRRYAIFKYLHKDGKFKVSDSLDYTPLYEYLNVEEMRYVFNNNIDDEEILWLNAYVQTKIEETGRTNWLTPHPHIAYIWPNYQNPIYYAEENVDYFNDLFKVSKTTLNEDYVENIENNKLFDLKFIIPGGKNVPKYEIKVTRGTPDYKVYKVWMNFRNKFNTGCVCGGISKSGSNISGTHGIPSAVIGQPGHAALLRYGKDANGKGFWGIDNDVSGWTLSEKGERLPLGWGNASFSRGYQVVYITLAQEVLNNYDTFVESSKKIMLADVYKDDLDKQEDILREALEIQPLNIDAWYALIQNYNSRKDIKEDKYYDLAEELAENLKAFPLPMYHLTNLIKPKLTSIQNSYKFSLLQERILVEGTTLKNTAEKYYVYQPSITNAEARYLLGLTDNSIASFSFNGSDAGKIVLSSKFDGNGIRWDYSLDGKKTWKEVSFDGNEEHKLQLTSKEISSITSENDIYVHVVGVDYSENNLYKIDITEQTLPSDLYANDLENAIIGATELMEWRMEGTKKWTSYSESAPDLTGDKTVEVRISANGTKLTSSSSTYTFTKDDDSLTRKYVPISHLSIAGVSTEATGQKRYAKNAIDGNYNTNWHSAWNGSDTERFIIIKLDKSIYLSEIEYIPGGGGNGKILDGTIYGSTDGENWTELKKVENLTYTGNVNAYDHGLLNKKQFTFESPQKVSYVKIKADRASNGNWFVITMLNFYEDASKLPKNPTASISYSTTKPTGDDVIASLVNPSTKITVTNNNGSDTYKFTENGSFTFEFVDEYGHKGTAEAKVDWIDKDIPNADIKYEVDSNNKLIVILDDISEDVYLLDKDNKKINFIETKDKKVSSIKYLDDRGNTIKTYKLDEHGNINSVVYKNTVNSLSNIAEYVTNIRNGVLIDEEFLDEDGNSVGVGDTYINGAGETVLITEEDLNAVRALQQPITNPIEYTFDNSGDYEFKFMDTANNVAFKSIKVDYIDNNNTILASDITYDITKLTNKDVTAKINPYLIENGEKNNNVSLLDKLNEAILSDNYVFKENGSHTFRYKSNADVNNWEVKEHTANVNWIDKVNPTAEIVYSTLESDVNEVIATLTNESETIKIINNGGNRNYKFTENGSFVFVIEDLAGNEAKITATVNNIKKKDEVSDNNNNNEPDDTEVTPDQNKTDVADENNDLPDDANQSFTFSANDPAPTTYLSSTNAANENEAKKTNEEIEEEVKKQEFEEFKKTPEFKTRKKKVDTVLLMDIVLLIAVILLIIRIIIYKKQMKEA